MDGSRSQKGEAMKYKDVLAQGKKQLEYEIKILKEVIKHHGGKGRAAEYALTEFLKNHLHKKYSLDKGFVVNNEVLSPEHDIIIHDEIINVPVLSTEGSKCFAGGAVYGVIEITLQKLNYKKLEEDIKKLGKLRKMFPNGKVGFKTFEYIPVIDKERLGSFIESGISIEDVWEEGIKKGYWGKSGNVLKKLRNEKLVLNNMTDERSKELKKTIVKNKAVSPHTVIQEKNIFSSPPPRMYIFALDGTTYKNAETLKKNIEKLTIEQTAHLHGLLVLGATDADDWFFANIAYADNKVCFESGNVIHKILTGMIKGFNGMLVGKLPALM